MEIRKCRCSMCKEFKGIDKFYKYRKSPSGCQGYCKECDNKRVRDRSRYFLSYHFSRKNKEQYKKKNREKVRTYNKKECNQEKINARKLAKKAFKKPQPCEICGDIGEQHHTDYSKPLDIQWLCRKHHLEIHKKSS